jgi:hypothetical protein
MANNQVVKKTLTPVTLDIVIERITPKTVYYKLFINSREENWRVHPNTTFDITTLVVGQRYIVKSRGVPCDWFDFKTQQMTWTERYDWLSAEPVVDKKKLHSRTAKQRKDAENLPPVANEDLFQW